MPETLGLCYRLFKSLSSGLLILISIVLVTWAFARVIHREIWPNSGQADQAVRTRAELVVMHWSGEGGQQEDAIVEHALERFYENNPGVRVRRINPGDAGSFYTKLQTMMAAGEPPDVFYVGAERIASFSDYGLLLPLDDYLQPGDLDDFFPATVDAFRFDGQSVGAGTLYGIPKDFTTVGFFYNKDLFDTAGIPYPQPDWNWDDFIAAARTIGQLPDCTGAEFVTWPMMIRAYLWTEGVDVRGTDFDDVTLDDPIVFETLDRLRAWRHDETGALLSGKSKMVTGASVFLTGKVGMAGPFGRWVVPSYREIPTPENGGFDWDYAPLPQGRVKANAIATVSWAISSATQHPDEAWELVKWLTSEECQADLSRLGLAIPTRRSVAYSDAFIDPDVKPASDMAFLEPAEYASVVDWPINPKFESLLGNRLDQALKTGDLPLDQAIANFKQMWQDESQSPLSKDEFPRMQWSLLVQIAAIVVAAAFVITWVMRRRTKLTPASRAEERAGYLLASPWILGFVIFMAFPIVLSLVLSLAEWKAVSTLDNARFVGLANYKQILFHDSRFRTSLYVTLYYALLAVPGGQLVALLSALLMNLKVRGIEIYRAAWYLPSVLAGVGVSILWRWVFDADGGLMNALLEPLLTPLGVTAPEWFGSDAKLFGPPAFAIMSLWMVGGSMMIYLAGLQNIPRELYEAASIDRAGPVARFFTVTLPMLGPVMLFNLIMAVIGSFQVFTQAFVMTGGEPGDLTRFYVLYLYNQAFEFHEMGYASGMAWILLVIILILTVIIMRTSARFVYYEALKK
ncbi:MAG: extracellular solute-binding protein [Planctomycetes bacterium]|nr:extracellular solute-binding protein [Planctomycetota bacterium]NOG55333.1 extracellular solute-binding protein [Planctomycetota bacterium]